MPVDVELRPRAVRNARQLAAERYESFKEISDDPGWGHTPEYRHYFGLLGEWAYAEYYDLQLDSQTYVRSDDGVDFRVRIDTDEFDGEEVGVDVKSTSIEDAELLIEKGQVDADYFVLCRFPQGIPESNTRGHIEIVGGATKEMVLNREPRWSPKHEHYNYHVSPRYLLELPSPEKVRPLD